MSSFELLKFQNAKSLSKSEDDRLGDVHTCKRPNAGINMRMDKRIIKLGTAIIDDGVPFQATRLESTVGTAILMNC